MSLHRLPYHPEADKDLTPSCYICAHVSYPYGETWCLLYNEPILSEVKAAADCPAYNPEPV